VRLRILHIVADLDSGGLERLVVDIARGSDPSRFETHVLVLDFPGRNAASLGGAAQLHQSGPLPRWSMLHPGPLIRQIRTIAPHVVHTHSGVWYKASLAACRAGVPRLIHTDHGRPWPDPWSARLADRLAARRTDVIVAVSEPLAGFLATRLHVPPERLRIVLNGVDTARFEPRPDDGALRRELGLARDAPILGSIGRLDYIKGYDVMLEAMARLLAEWRGDQAPVLVLAGDGPERESLRRRLGELGLDGRALLLGWRDDVEALHRAFTVFTLASRSEGTSIGLLEAMSAGLCPVITDVGGNAAVLGPSLRHRLVPAESPTALAAAWGAALSDSQRRTADAALARARVRDHYSLQSMVSVYESLYEGREPST
jgi:glycosyltransferase involved in cell wall biosynthesis